MKKKKNLILVILILLSLVVLTTGVSYSFFKYIKQGTTDNIIKTGKITFLYTEVEANGSGISIEDAFPMSDEKGMEQAGAKKVFNFTIQSQNDGKASIPYEVTARKKSDSTLDESAVRLYLTEVTGNENETELKLETYNNLNQTSVKGIDGIVEKTIYTDTVPADSTYEKNFRLRMWINDDIDFSPNPDGTYPYNNKTFTITINVYANAEVINLPNSSM